MAAARMDFLVLAGIVLLIVVTPLAIGSVHPVVYSVVEAAVFGLVLLWIARTRSHPFASASLLPDELARLVLPMGLFLGMVGLQLVPLPPALLRVIAPGTYSIYAHTLEPWPDGTPYNWIRTLPQAPPSSAPALLLTPQEADEQLRAQRSVGGTEGRSKSTLIYGGRWRPLSIAPQLTATLLLKCLAYAGLFLVVLLYRFEDDRGEVKFRRRILRTILASGTIVALLGLIEQARWNGKILWVFVPYQWSGPLNTMRASGPFVNSDHFGNYLVMILPLAAAGLLYETALERRRRQSRGVSTSEGEYRIFCGFAVFALLAGALMSASRAALAGVPITIVMLLSLSYRGQTSLRASLPLGIRLGRGTAILVAVGLLVLALVFIGKSGRGQIHERVSYALTDNDTGDSRLAAWRVALRMARDFPIFGVGFGGWPELYRRYTSAPWNSTLWLQTHNDFLQALVEMGLIGSFLLTWFFINATRLLWRDFGKLEPRWKPLVAGLLAGLVFMALHELVDFPMQVPANAMLAAVFAALALRITLRPVEVEAGQSRSGRLAAVAVIVLTILALGQDRVPYPFNLHRPTSAEEAQALAQMHPANSRVHVVISEFLAEKKAPDEVRAGELGRALYLEPTNPLARDLLADVLAEQGHTDLAAKEIQQSVRDAPSADSHVYLNPRLVPWLPKWQHDAIQAGLTAAVDLEYPGAIQGQAAYLYGLGQFRRAGEVTEAAAENAHSSDREAMLLTATDYYLAADDSAAAERVMRKAIAIDPRNPDLYKKLVLDVYGSARNVASAKNATHEAIANGVEPFAAYVTLARVEGAAGDKEGVIDSLTKALSYKPQDWEAMYGLGITYYRMGRLEKSIAMMRQASQLNPASVDLFYDLAVAEEAAFQYFDAQRDYERALALSNQDDRIRSNYERFKLKVAAGMKNSPTTQ